MASSFFYNAWWITFILGKLSLYSVFICRLYLTFQDSHFAYSKWKVYVPIILLMILQLINVIIEMIFGGSYFESNPIIIITQLSILITDAILVVFLLYLFINPLLKLMAMTRLQSMDTYNGNQYIIVKLTAKITLLTSVALISSFLWQLTWVISLSQGHKHREMLYLLYLISADMVINMFCVTLTYQFAERYYQIICIDALRFHSCCFKMVKKVVANRNKTRSGSVGSLQSVQSLQMSEYGSLVRSLKKRNMYLRNKDLHIRNRNFDLRKRNGWW